MTTRLPLCLTLVAFSCITAGPALALSAKDCSGKYEAAKQAGTLAGMTWNAFRKAQCGAEAAPVATPSTAAAPAAAPVAKTSPTPAAMTTTGPAVFPKAIDAKYAGEVASKGRMHTCLDQYKANKVAIGGAANGGMTWIQKGGGYYSACNKRLKG